MPSPLLTAVHAYHDGTKHHFHRFARSSGLLDWASQPHPFRSFAGAPTVPLSPRPEVPAGLVGDLLRYSLGLSAWKCFGDSRWSLRVNPSSGNLHPTEAYIIGGPPTVDDVARSSAERAAGVYHYAPDRHALEQRCVFDSAVWSVAVSDPGFLIALTSIHWREAWKYGERAFRYCQHDLGHAIAAVRIAAEVAGLRARILPDWSHADIAALTGIDRDEDFVEAEREEAGCLIVVVSLSSAFSSAGDSRQASARALLAAVRAGRWTGRASQLSEDHVHVDVHRRDCRGDARCRSFLPSCLPALPAPLRLSCPLLPLPPI